MWTSSATNQKIAKARNAQPEGEDSSTTRTVDQSWVSSFFTISVDQGLVNAWCSMAITAGRSLSAILRRRVVGASSLTGRSSWISLLRREGPEETNVDL